LTYLIIYDTISSIYNAIIMERNDRKLPKTATDMEFVLCLSQHIQNPCKDMHGNNIRDFYIRVARNAMASFTNPYAKTLIEDVIKKYSE
jgi:hypothetical protein